MVDDYDNYKMPESANANYLVMFLVFTIVAMRQRMIHSDVSQDSACMPGGTVVLPDNDWSQFSTVTTHCANSASALPSPVASSFITPSNVDISWHIHYKPPVLVQDQLTDLGGALPLLKFLTRKSGVGRVEDPLGWLKTLGLWEQLENSFWMLGGAGLHFSQKG